jgi:hypothetical protein
VGRLAKAVFLNIIYLRLRRSVFSDFVFFISAHKIKADQLVYFVRKVLSTNTRKQEKKEKEKC